MGSGVGEGVPVIEGVLLGGGVLLAMISVPVGAAVDAPGACPHEVLRSKINWMASTARQESFMLPPYCLAQRAMHFSTGSIGST
jgi:hypothetical protein